MTKQFFVFLAAFGILLGTADAAISKTAGLKAAFKSSEKKLRQLRPTKDLDARVQALYTELMSQPPRVASLSGNKVELQIDAANKSDWLQAVYSRNLVDASEQTLLLADKLMMAKVIEQGMGPERAHAFLPKTVGLKEFLDRNHFVNKRGKIKATGEQIEHALYKEFPAGFMIRPAVGVAPTETTKGLFQDSDHFIAQLVEGKFEGYKAEHFWNPVKSHILDTVASGEAVVIQDDIILRAEAQKKLHARAFREIRIHTYEDNVIADAVPTRWVQKAKVTEEETKLAEAFVNEFLKALPPRLLTRQAWGVDVAVFDNGQVIINDIVTNLGRKRAWSSYLEQPRVIGAYTRHFENTAGVRFTGIEGALARNNLGNYFSYWHERIEKAPEGLSRVLSYLPPLP
jgi:hypothetical protein